MKKLLLVIALMASMPAFADTPPSEASIRELMALTDARKLLDAAYAQMEGAMGQAMKPALGDAAANAQQKALIEEFQHKAVELMQKEMGWDKLEPAYLQLYSKTFSQSEIDGMLVFYKSEPGRAVLAKMPLLMTNMTEMMMGMMQQVTPGLQKLVGEYVRKVQDAK
jgi:hypothetical protein